MPRKSHEQFLAEVKAVTPEQCVTYNGGALFAPSAKKFAEALGVTHAMLYHGGTSYEEKLQLSTGLQVVHNGIVLGDPTGLAAPAAMPENLQKISEEISALPDEQKVRLIAALSVSNTVQ